MQKTKMWSPAWEGLGTGTFQTVDSSPHAFLHLPIRLSIYCVHSFLHLLIYLFHTWSPGRKSCLEVAGVQVRIMALQRPSGSPQAWLPQLQGGDGGGGGARERHAVSGN